MSCRKLASRSACWASAGWISTTPQESHVLRALQGWTISALELIGIMYAGFKRIEPGMDIGVDLAQEYEIAKRLDPLYFLQLDLIDRSSNWIFTKFNYYFLYTIGATARLFIML